MTKKLTYLILAGIPFLFSVISLWWNSDILKFYTLSSPIALSCFCLGTSIGILFGAAIAEENSSIFGIPVRKMIRNGA